MYVVFLCVKLFLFFEESCNLCVGLGLGEGEEELFLLFILVLGLCVCSAAVL